MFDYCLAEIHLDRAVPRVKEAELITSGMRGWCVKFTFGPEWDDLPVRKASFTYGVITVTAEIIDGVATVPAEVLDDPCHHFLVGAVGYDKESDPAAVERAREIDARLAEIDIALRTTATDENVAELMEEYSALLDERRTLDLASVVYPSTWAPVGWILPGTRAAMDDE